MEAERLIAEQRARDEEERLSAGGMLLLTGGITQEGDAFLIGVGAAILFCVLYPLIDLWALLAFPGILIAAVLVRGRIRRRRKAQTP